MKDEYRRQFVDVNFYGYQSKVQNPMSSVSWRFKQNKDEFNVDAENEALRNLAAQKQRLAKTTANFFTPKKEDLSFDDKEKAQMEMLDRFKDNVVKLQNKRGAINDSKGLSANNAGKYKHLLSMIEEDGNKVSSSSPGGFMGLPKKETSLKRGSGQQGKLWALIDKLKCQKGEELDSKEKNQRLEKRAQYIRELDHQMLSKNYLKQIEN